MHSEKTAAELLDLANKYRKTHPAIARMYYEKLLKLYPNSQESNDAYRWREKIRSDMSPQAPK